MTLTCKRLATGWTKLFIDGREVGEVFKYTQARGFGLRLRGIYWRGDEPNKRGGATGRSFRTRKEAIAAAEHTLASL